MVSFTAIVFSVAFCILVRCSESHEFPKDFVRCRPTDNDCLLKRANEIMHAYPHGYPEIALGGFEPFQIDDIKLSGNSDSPVNVNLQMSNLLLHGYANMTFTKFGGFTDDPKNVKVNTESVNPLLVIKGKYKISGKLLVLPINGEGDCQVTIKGLQIKAQMKPKLEVKNGKTYLKSDIYKLKIKADDVHIELENLFNGDKTLGDNMLKIMNENWKVLWDELEPEFNQQIRKANLKILDSMLEKIPYEELFIHD